MLYLYAWTLSLAALALALRFVPYSDDDGTLNAGWTAVILLRAVALAASVYLVMVLEILKFRRFRERQMRRAVGDRRDAGAERARRSRHEIEREVETGEFEAVLETGSPAPSERGLPGSGRGGRPGAARRCARGRALARPRAADRPADPLPLRLGA